MNAKPTLLGLVGSVTGARVSVRQIESVASGVAMIGGKGYRVGQVGSFVRIPQGYQHLFGIISEVGAVAVPATAAAPAERGERWLTVQLVGEASGSSFERGISQFPNINDEVHLVTEDDLSIIYGTQESGQIAVGRLSNAEGVPVRVDLDKLVTRHSAVVGSTGSGKSTSVASLLRSIARGTHGSGGAGFASARILLVDIHGEYARALLGMSRVFRVSPSDGEEQLYVPYWALDPAEVLGFLMGRLEDRALTQIMDRIFQMKVSAAQAARLPGIDVNSMSSESPVPYSLRQLWFDLIDPEIKTWSDPQKTIPALDAAGDAQTLRPNKYKPHSTTNTAPYLNTVGVLSIRRSLDQMRSRLLDRQYDFMLNPGPWDPSLSGKTASDIEHLVQSWVGHEHPITVLDLSGIPSFIINRLVGGILKILYDSLFWSREKSEGGIGRPLLVVMEEAHRYLGNDSDGLAKLMAQRIVKEGRKFGIGGMFVSQRPSELDETILSQCGTFIALRLSNAVDRGKVQASLPDSLAGIVDSLPVLRTGEAIITGEAAKLPIRCRISLPPEGERPNSEDPPVAANWSLPRVGEDYGRVAASWRSQDPKWTSISVKRIAIQPDPEAASMDRQPVSSSNISEIGYDDSSETLEVQFSNGSIYQYYNVPRIVYDSFMESASKGQYLSANIRNKFACSKA